MTAKSQATANGHIRAQHCTMYTADAQALQYEQAQITAYEDGWDDWDGPVWPWRHTNLPSRSKEEEEDKYEGCCCCDEKIQELKLASETPERTQVVGRKEGKEGGEQGPPLDSRSAGSSSTVSVATVSSVKSTAEGSEGGTGTLWVARSSCLTCRRNGA